MTEFLHSDVPAQTQQRDSENNASRSVHFKNPPINELVIGLFFNPPLPNLRSEHIGLFWERIRDKFPVVEQRQPTVSPNIFTSDDNEPYPMPRYFFLNEEGNTLLQVQKPSFFLNWKKGNSDYPHFHELLKPTFDEYFSIFSDFIERETNTDGLHITACELTYVNLVEHSEYWTGPQDTHIVFPFLQSPDVDLNPSDFSASEHTYIYRTDPDNQIKLSIKDSLQTTDTNEPILFFELNAIGLLGNGSKSDADSWFDRAHSRLLSVFQHTTSSQIQEKYWKPGGNSNECG